MTDWTKRFIDMADLVASWSKDPSTKVGAVIVRPDKKVASVGFNGFAKGADDSPALYLNRDYKIANIIHAEDNAIQNCYEDEMYMYDYSIYLTHPPCRQCAAEIKHAGITTVYFKSPTEEMVKRWNIQESLDYLDQHGIEYHSYDPTRTPPTH